METSDASPATCLTECQSTTADPALTGIPSLGNIPWTSIVLMAPTMSVMESELKNEHIYNKQETRNKSGTRYKIQQK